MATPLTFSEVLSHKRSKLVSGDEPPDGVGMHGAEPRDCGGNVAPPGGPHLQQSADPHRRVQDGMSGQHPLADAVAFPTAGLWSPQMHQPTLAPAALATAASLDAAAAAATFSSVGCSTQPSYIGDLLLRTHPAVMNAAMAVEPLLRSLHLGVPYHQHAWLSPHDVAALPCQPHSPGERAAAAAPHDVPPSAFSDFHFTPKPRSPPAPAFLSAASDPFLPAIPGSLLPASLSQAASPFAGLSVNPMLLVPPEPNRASAASESADGLSRARPEAVGSAAHAAPEDAGPVRRGRGRGPARHDHIQGYSRRHGTRASAQPAPAPAGGSSAPKDSPPRTPQSPASSTAAAPMVALPPEQHIERDERGVRKASDPSSYRFPCTMCDRAFTRKYNLDAHLLVHQNIKPYKCMHSGCTEAFVRKYDLKRHDRTIHERRSFARCPHCSLVLARSDSFRKHTRICTSLTGQGRAVLSNGDESSDDGSFTADTDAASTSSRGTKRKG